MKDLTMSGVLDTSALLTGWKRDPDLVCLSQVSAVPLQQALAHLQTAYTRFWAKRAAYPGSGRSGSPAGAPSTAGPGSG